MQKKRSTFTFASAGKKSRPKTRKTRKRSDKQVLADHIFWCNSCNVPLIGPVCDICGREGTKLPLTSPCDVRFASAYERELLDGLLRQLYDCNPFVDRVVLLNKVAGDDRNDEVLVDGIRIGQMYFDILQKQFRFEPTDMGASVLLNHTHSKTAHLHYSGRHLNGKKISLEGIDHFSPDIEKGDPVLLRCGNLVGIGISLEDSANYRPGKPLLRVKKIKKISANLKQSAPSMDSVIKANQSSLKRIESNAINMIKGIGNDPAYSSFPVNVSFSGGKDSLVVLDLARKALDASRLRAIFLNTGIEFPETVQFAHEFCNANDIELIEKRAENAFWDNVESFGPPGKDFRWCCKVCKLGPANSAFESCSADNPCLAVDGKRKYESFSRQETAATEANPFVPGQLNVFPIRQWRAIEVWLYIYWKKLAYNPLYDMGFERVGCYLCPSTPECEFERVRQLFPDLYERWMTYLQNWTASKGLPPEYAEYGFWRWQQHPPKMLALAKQLGISITPVETEDFSISAVSGHSVCSGGDFSVEARIRGVSLLEAADVMRMLGNVVYSPEIGVVLAKGRSYTVKFFASGNLKVTASDRKIADRMYRNTCLQLLRIARCSGCGVCLNACARGSIELKNGKIKIHDSCSGCGKCNESCVVVRYANRIIPDI